MGIQSVMLVQYFRPSFVNCFPSNLFSHSTFFRLFPPSLCQIIVYTDNMWLGGGGGFWVPLETVFFRSLTTCIWPYSEPTKLLLHHPKQKLSWGGAPGCWNTCRKVPLQVNFFKMTTFCFGLLVHDMHCTLSVHNTVYDLTCTSLWYSPRQEKKLIHWWIQYIYY